MNGNWPKLHFWRTGRYNITRDIMKEAGERRIIVDVAKSHKRPILYTLVIDVDEWKFHQCGNCVYNTDCHYKCKVLEASYPIREFVKEKFEVNLHELSLVPIHKIKP